MQDFLLLEEQEAMTVLTAAVGECKNNKPMGVAARIRGTFRWAAELPPVLSSVDLEVKRGELVVIVGATGSGKTSLLNILLGLLQPESGQQVLLRGSVAYVSQTAFIYGGAFHSPMSSVYLIPGISGSQPRFVLVCIIFLLQFCILMDISNSKNYLGISVITTIT